MDLDAIRLQASEGLSGLLAALMSPRGLGQVITIAVVVGLAPIIARILRRRFPAFRTAPEPGAKLAPLKALAFRLGALLRAVILAGLLAAAIPVYRSAMGGASILQIALALALVFLLYRAIRELVPAQFRKPLNIVLLPLAALAAFGLLDEALAAIDGLFAFNLLGATFTPLSIVRILIAAGLLFWAGGKFNARGQTAIRSQEGLDTGLREIAAKFFQIILFGLLFILLLNVAGIPLSGLVVIVSALGLGIGLGLQSVAANFVSGLIILIDRSVRIGDFVQLEDGRAGHVDAINMRSTTLETADGKDILVPNLTFIENAYENWTHRDVTQRFEVAFTVHYDTDLDSLEDMLIPAVLAHPDVLEAPELPDLELRGFGNNGIEMAIEFWVEGIDDGPNKFTSDVGFIIWRTLKANGVKMPYPQLVVHRAESP